MNFLIKACEGILLKNNGILSFRRIVKKILFKVGVELSGIHSRSEATVKITQDFERNRASGEQVSQQIKDDTRKLLQLQRRLGFEVLGSGQIRWQDQLRPFTDNIEGISQDANYSRWFDTNTFYRKPTINGRIRYTPKLFANIADEFLDIDMDKDVKKKLCIVGPLTFLDLSDNNWYASKREFFDDFFVSLGEFSVELQKNGISVLQISEPSLVYSDFQHDTETLEVYANVLNSRLREVSVSRTELHTFFGNAAKIWNFLCGLDVDALGVDFSYTTVDEITTNHRGDGFSGKSLIAGVADSRNSLLEDPSYITEICKNLKNKLRPNGIVLSPTTDLKFLPREIADSKLLLLSRIKNEVETTS
jgi:5-methyltetrahydropteroyltriglutamate--homocysteine methyltransferase